MMLTYSPSSSLTIASQNCKLFGRKSCNVRTICPPISPSLGFHSYNGRSISKNTSTKRYKLSFIRACTQSKSEPIVTKGASNFGDACWRFLRPYTLKGTAIGSSAILTRLLLQNPNLIEWSLVFKALSGFFALVCVNSYVVGINQIYDADIDKINKPHLPIAAGDLSVESAWLLVLFFAAAGFSVVGLTCGPLITCLYGFALLLGTAYSIPPFRLKSIPLGTILTIALKRGFLLNFGVYYSLKGTFGLPFQWSPPLVFITTFATVFGVVIAITKDLTDVEGDSKYGITTLATKLGIKKVAFLGSGLLLLNYVGAILTAVYMPQALNRTLMIPMHSIFAFTLIYQTRILEQANYTMEAILKFYMFIWNLFYAEYIIFPFI